MLNASMLLSRGTITSPPKVKQVEGIPLPILHQTHSNPIPSLKTGLHIIVMVVSTIANMFVTLFQAVLRHLTL